jgi:hypothetical protein
VAVGHRSENLTGISLRLLEFFFWCPLGCIPRQRFTSSYVGKTERGPTNMLMSSSSERTPGHRIAQLSSLGSINMRLYQPRRCQNSNYKNPNEFIVRILRLLVLRSEHRADIDPDQSDQTMSVLDPKNNHHIGWNSFREDCLMLRFGNVAHAQVQKVSRSPPALVQKYQDEMEYK